MLETEEPLPERDVAGLISDQGLEGTVEARRSDGQERPVEREIEDLVEDKPTGSSSLPLCCDHARKRAPTGRCSGHFCRRIHGPRSGTMAGPPRGPHRGRHHRRHPHGAHGCAAVERGGACRRCPYPRAALWHDGRGGVPPALGLFQSRHPLGDSAGEDTADRARGGHRGRRHSSALFVNDVVCLVLAPLVVDVTRRLALPPVPYLVALATAANVGSVATLTGNPQNMLVGSFSHLSY